MKIQRKFRINTQQIDGEVSRRDFGSRIIRAVKREDGTIRIDVRSVMGWRLDINPVQAREVILCQITGTKCKRFIEAYAPDLLTRPLIEPKPEK